MKRYAIIRNALTRAEAEAYLPSNYEIIYERGAPASVSSRELRAEGRRVFVIAGEDRAGWTLDGYVIPRYASGLIVAEEIDLSHPIMREVPM